MAAEVSAFGYTVPLVVVLVFIALVLGLALAVSFYLTAGWSVYRSVVETRRERVRDTLQTELLDRLFSDDSDWQSWVVDMSGVERRVAESLLDEYLRELEGAEADRLRGLGDALEIPERCRRNLETGNEFDRLDALTWLTLLRRPEVYEAAGFEPETARERASTARLLYESDALDEMADGIDILLRGIDEEFTVFGQDTLYRIAAENPDALLSRAATEFQSWPQSLLVQVLTVCEHLETSVGAGELRWLAATLDHDAEAVRVATARALGSFGWHEELRDQSFLERATADPSPRVRGAVYEMLASWGDQAALSILMYELVTEDDPRALVRGTNALVSRRDRIDEMAPAVFGNTWDWSLEHADYDRLARRGREVET